MRALAAFAVLLALALAVGLSRGFALWVTGFKPLGEPDPAQLDEPFEIDDREAPRFLAERNRVEIEVPRDMPALALLRLYQIDHPHVRAEIAREEGVPFLADDHRLRQGRRYRITLTPPAEGAP